MDRRNFQIIEKSSRLFADRFRWKPGEQTRLGKKKFSGSGAKSVDELLD